MGAERGTKGHLSKTLENHQRMGSSGTGFEHLIEGEVQRDVPFGEQMTTETLQEYYDDQLQGVRSVLQLSEDKQKTMGGLIRGFEADLDYLETRGIDTTTARELFEKR